MRLIRDFGRWLAAIFSQWKSGVSGGGGILMSIYSAFVDQPQSQQIVFAAGAIGCLLFAFFMSWRELYQKVETEEARETKRAALGAFIDEAHTLRESCKSTSETELEKTVLEWLHRAEDYLKGNFGESYIIRFRSDIGHPMRYSEPGSPEQRRWSGVLHVRMFNLNTFVAELASRH